LSPHTWHHRIPTTWPRKVTKPPQGGFFYGKSMSDFAAALMRLWPNGDEKIPGLRAGMIASAPAVFAKHGTTSPFWSPM
jgi:hypothetical protein